MKKTKKAIVSLAIAGMALTMIPFNTFAVSTVPTRIAGGTAPQTAASIADQTGWTETAILASTASYGMVDALTAGPLAMFLKAPILLTEPGNALNVDTKAELIKLNVKKVYITSGTAVISQAVLDELKGMGITVESLGGDDRFATSANIAQKMVTLGASVNKVAVAYGWLNQDALSIASIAAAQTQPILLTERDTVPASVKTFLTNNPSVNKTDVIGGTGVISDAVSAQFPSPTRQFGNTAYDTNKAVLIAFDNVIKYDNVFLANGETAIDALTGAPLAAQYNAGIVLVNGATNEGTTYVNSKLSSSSIVTALGGTAVVTDSVLSAVSNVVPNVDSAETTATNLVVKAESSKTQADKDAALTAVNALPASVTKTALLARIEAIIVNTAETTATNLVVKAEGSKTQVDKDAASTAVNALPASVAKTALSARIEAINVNTAEITATNLVVKAEGSKTQADKDAALTAVNALPASVTKTALLARIEAIKIVIIDEDLPTYTVTAQESGLLGNKIITVTLNTANDNQYTVKVEGTELVYSTIKDAFVGVVETNKTEFTVVIAEK